MALVKITVQNGETGLRRPGTIVSVTAATAEVWVERGWAEKVKKARRPREKTGKKQEKTAFETKEQKPGKEVSDEPEPVE